MRKVILVLDPDHRTHDVVRRLDPLKFRVVHTTHVEKALLFVSTIKPAAFIIDLRPCGQSGIELAADLRAAGFRRTPMIGISDTAVMLQVAALHDVFDGYLTKPLTLERLADELTCLLEPATGTCAVG